jgi:hypothetical protein
MKQLRDRLWAATALAALLSASPALAAQLPLTSGPQDPSQLQASLNNLILTINNSLGLYAPQVGAGINGSDTTTDTLQTIIVPANFFTANGQTLHLLASGINAGAAANKTVGLTFGTITISATSASAVAWKASLDIVNLGSAGTSQVYSGVIDFSGVTPTVFQGTATIATATAQTSTVTGRTDTAASGVVQANYFIGEIVK